MKQLEHDLLGEADTKAPAKKEVKPAAKTKTEEKKTITLPNLHDQLAARREEQMAGIKMPKLGDHVLFRKAENGDVVDHLAIVMSVPQSSTCLSLNVLKQGYMDFVKSAPFSEEKQPHTWGFLK